MFSAEIEHDCEELAVRWSFLPAIPGADLSSPSFSATLENHGPYRGVLFAQCRMCPGSSKTENFELTAFEIEAIESGDSSLVEVPKGSAGESVFPFAAMRTEGGQARLEAKVVPAIDASRLEGKGFQPWPAGRAAFVDGDIFGPDPKLPAPFNQPFGEPEAWDEAAYREISSALGDLREDRRALIEQAWTRLQELRTDAAQSSAEDRRP